MVGKGKLPFLSCSWRQMLILHPQEAFLVQGGDVVHRADATLVLVAGVVAVAHLICIISS